MPGRRERKRETNNRDLLLFLSVSLFASFFLSRAFDLQARKDDKNRVDV